MQKTAGARQLHLGAFMRPVSIHTGAWRYPGAYADANFNFKHLKRFAQKLEAIGVDEVACLIDFGPSFESVMASLLIKYCTVLWNWQTGLERLPSHDFNVCPNPHTKHCP